MRRALDLVAKAAAAAAFVAGVEFFFGRRRLVPRGLVPLAFASSLFAAAGVVRGSSAAPRQRTHLHEATFKHERVASRCCFRAICPLASDFLSAGNERAVLADSR